LRQHAGAGDGDSASTQNAPALAGRVERLTSARAAHFLPLSNSPKKIVKRYLIGFFSGHWRREGEHSALLDAEWEKFAIGAELIDSDMHRSR
jgi:hypothetical protein